MKAYSDDLREKVLKALQNGQSAKDVSARFDVGISGRGSKELLNHQFSDILPI